MGRVPRCSLPDESALLVGNAVSALRQLFAKHGAKMLASGTATAIDFQQSVILMGGEYLFAPSISFLQSFENSWRRP